MTGLSEIKDTKNACPEALADLAYLYEHGSFNYDNSELFKVPIDLKKSYNLNDKARGLYLSRAVNNLGLLFFNNKEVDILNPNQKSDS